MKNIIEESLKEKSQQQTNNFIQKQFNSRDILIVDKNIKNRGNTQGIVTISSINSFLEEFQNLPVRYKNIVQNIKLTINKNELKILPKEILNILEGNNLYGIIPLKEAYANLDKVSEYLTTVNQKDNHKIIKYIEFILSDLTSRQVRLFLNLRGYEKRKINFNISDLEKTDLTKKYIDIFNGFSRTLTPMDVHSEYNYHLIDSDDKLLGGSLDFVEIFEKIKEQVETHKIKHIVINDLELISNIDFVVFNNYLSSKNIRLICNGENITLTNIEKDNLLYHSFDKTIRDNQNNKTYYTASNKFYNQDVLRIEDIYLFNMVKDQFYDKKHMLDNRKDIEYVESSIARSYFFHHTNEKGITIKEHPENNSDTYFETIPTMFQKYKQENLPTNITQLKDISQNFKVVGLEIEDAQDLENISAINYKYEELSSFLNANNLNQDRNKTLTWFINHKLIKEGKLQKKYIKVNGSMVQTDSKYDPLSIFILDLIFKFYKNDFNYLKTKDGSQLKTQNDYLKLIKNLAEKELDIEQHFKIILLNTIKPLESTPPQLDTLNLLNYPRTEAENKIIDKTVTLMWQNFVDYVVNNEVLIGQDQELNKRMLENFILELPNRLYFMYTQEINKSVSKNIYKISEFENTSNTDMVIKNNNLFNGDSRIITLDYFNDLPKKILSTVSLASKWHRINFEINNIFPLKKLMQDSQSIIDGENPFKLKPEPLQKVQHNFIYLNKQPEWISLKKSLEVFNQNDINKFVNIIHKPNFDNINLFTKEQQQIITHYLVNSINATDGLYKAFENILTSKILEDMNTTEDITNKVLAIVLDNRNILLKEILKELAKKYKVLFLICESTQSTKLLKNEDGYSIPTEVIELEVVNLINIATKNNNGIFEYNLINKNRYWNSIKMDESILRVNG